jgi:hypothetical protein
MKKTLIIIAMTFGTVFASNEDCNSKIGEMDVREPVSTYFNIMKECNDVLTQHWVINSNECMKIFGMTNANVGEFLIQLNKDDMKTSFMQACLMGDYRDFTLRD